MTLYQADQILAMIPVRFVQHLEGDARIEYAKMLMEFTALMTHRTEYYRDALNRKKSIEHFNNFTKGYYAAWRKEFNKPPPEDSKSHERRMNEIKAHYRRVQSEFDVLKESYRVSIENIERSAETAYPTPPEKKESLFRKLTKFIVS